MYANGTTSATVATGSGTFLGLNVKAAADACAYEVRDGLDDSGALIDSVGAGIGESNQLYVPGEGVPFAIGLRIKKLSGTSSGFTAYFV